MKIAHVLPYSVTFPLESHNGRYEWVRQLALQQIAHGHEVTIYCNPSSQSARLRFKGIDKDLGDKKANNIATFHLAFEDDSDVYHSHFDNLHYTVAKETAKPIVFTQHWWPTDETLDLAQRNPSNVWAVPPTQYMADFDQSHGIQTKSSIYHGIDLSVFRPAPVLKNGRLLFVGRIAPDKNIEAAISVAEKSGVALDIVGKITDKYRDYWEVLRKDIDGANVNYLGSKNREELVELYSGARAVICTFGTTEAFGLVAAEAQACGTPVLITPGGAHGELIDPEKTGFICGSIDEFVVAVSRASSINSEDCVNFVAKNFDDKIMFKKYEDLYRELI